MSLENCDTSDHRKTPTDSFEFDKKKTGLQGYVPEGIKPPKTGFWGMLNTLAQSIKPRKSGSEEEQIARNKQYKLEPLIATEKNPAKLKSYIEPVTTKKDCP